MSKKDNYFMERALELAQKAKGKTSPNPLVGAVVVKKNKIIAEGFHKKCGRPHAEKEALDKAGHKAKGATLYVNLEPCFSFGRTPPCVDKVIESGIKRIVIAAKDPNPKVFGKSIKKIRKNKIDVSVGICRRQAEKINEVFFKNMKNKMPFVAAKTAESLDGKIATYRGQSKWITGKPARNFSRRLRDNYEAILIGAETLRQDNPRLDGIKRIPYKIVISLSLNLPKNSYLLNNHSSKLIIFTSQKQKQNINLPENTKIFFLKETKKGLSPKSILKKLYSLGITSIFIEGGSYTLGRFFEERLVDKVYFFIAPRIIGGSKSLTAVGAGGFSRVKDSFELEQLEVSKVGKDLFIQAYPK